MSELEQIKTQFPVKKFWNNVRVTDDCWIWKDTSKVNLYGRFCYEGKTASPSRVLKIHIDKPKILNRTVFACHKCDNPPCVRPSHIFWGSQKDNIKDAVSKGRWFHRGFIGKRPKNQILEEHQVLLIRAFSRSVHRKSFEKILKIKSKSLWFIQAGHSWKQVETNPDKCMRILLKNHRKWLASVIPMMIPRSTRTR